MMRDVCAETDRVLNSLSGVLRTELTALLNSFRETVKSETLAVFRAILDSQPKTDGIYHLGLYYSSDSWDFCMPVWSSEWGLQRVITRQGPHSLMTEEENEAMFRWSIADSPHHTGGYHPEYMKLAERLDDLLAWEEKIDPEESPEVISEDDLDVLIDYWHSECHKAALDALTAIRREPDIADYCDGSGCILSLCETDQRERDWVEVIRIINGEQAATKFDLEIKQYQSMIDLRYSRVQEKLEQDRMNPPQPSFSFSDLSPVIDAFTPSYINSYDGAVLFEENSSNYQVFSSISDAEFRANKLEILFLLHSSEHYDEIERLYGGIVGNEFDENNVIVEFSKEIVNRLVTSLKSSFPEDDFVIYMYICRSSRSFITFYKSRGDGYCHTLHHSTEHPTMNFGVEETVRVKDA